MKIITLDPFHSILYKRASNFFLTQLWTFHRKKRLIFTYCKVKIHPLPFRSPILVSKKSQTYFCRGESVE